VLGFRYVEKFKIVTREDGGRRRRDLKLQITKDTHYYMQLNN
jgi:hypothetical protein